MATSRPLERSRRQTKAIDYPPLFSGTVLELDGKYYFIGEGHKEFLADKWQDKDLYLLNLMGIAKELHREHLTQADAHLVTIVPLTWVHRQKESFIPIVVYIPFYT